MIIADDKGRAEFKFADKLVKVTDIIGRSIVVAEGSDDLGKGNQPMSKVYIFFYSSFLFVFFIHLFYSFVFFYYVMKTDFLKNMYIMTMKTNFMLQVGK